MFRFVKVVDQTGSNCLSGSSSVVSISADDTFQSVLDRLQVPDVLSVRRLQLKECAETPDNAAITVSELTAKAADVIDFILAFP